MTVRAIFFDVGETLVDETRHWAAWADWLGVPHFTFFAVLGGLIARGEHHQRVFELVRPGLDLAGERAAKVAAGRPEAFERADLYPDALPCLATLRAGGYTIGLAGNQSAALERSLHGLGLPVDVVASSERWGVAKPSPAFFTRLVEVAGLAPGEIAYVGDRVDNDVVPAAAAGLVAVFLRRGPWGCLQAADPGVCQARLSLDSLAELPARLARLDAATE
jgi:FMN phosphatase YigB (HAD superfamily)